LRIAYTADLHLEFLTSNLQKKFAREFLVQDLAGMFCVQLDKTACDFAVVAGDTSHCVADVARFFSEVDKSVSKPIYVVLGNHDYWNWQSSLVRNYEELPNKNVGDIETWFRDKFSQFKNIKLLIAGDKYYYEDLKIIGDCGFSAYNNRFNFRQGIYRATINNAIQEKELTDRWRNFYKRETFTDEKTLIITHHPPTDWGQTYEPDYDERFYIFGHVHDIDERVSSGVEITKTGNYYGDAANGYSKSGIEFKVVVLY